MASLPTPRTLRASATAALDVRDEGECDTVDTRHKTQLARSQ